jgi:hypothetical protein
MTTATKQYDRDNFRDWLCDLCDNLTDATQQYLEEDPQNILRDPEEWTNTGMAKQTTFYLSRLYEACNGDAAAAVNELHKLSFMVKVQSAFMDNLLACACDLAEAE